MWRRRQHLSRFECICSLDWLFTLKSFCWAHPLLWKLLKVPIQVVSSTNKRAKSFHSPWFVWIKSNNTWSVSRHHWRTWRGWSRWALCVDVCCQVLLGKLDSIMPLKRKNKIKNNSPTKPNQKIHVIHVLHVQHLGHDDHFGHFGHFVILVILVILVIFFNFSHFFSFFSIFTSGKVQFKHRHCNA